MKNYRKYMLLAYKAMLKSKNYHNNENHQAPLVGGLLLYSDGRYITSYRDESNEFIHAESILLHKMNKNRLDDNAILFVTLEPCVHFIGNYSLLSCSELIVKYKIKNVCIGLIDPNPNISYKGIKFLKDNNVNVTFFDNDIIKKIIKANKAFIEFIKNQKKL